MFPMCCKSSHVSMTVFYFTGWTSLRFRWGTPYNSHVLFGCPKFEATTCLRQRPHCEWLGLSLHIWSTPKFCDAKVLLGQRERFDRFQGWGWCSQCGEVFTCLHDCFQLRRLDVFAISFGHAVLRMFCFVVPSSKPQLVPWNGLHCKKTVNGLVRNNIDWKLVSAPPKKSAIS